MSKLLTALITGVFAAALSMNAMAAKHMAGEAPKAEAKTEAKAEVKTEAKTEAKAEDKADKKDAKAAKKEKPRPTWRTWRLGGSLSQRQRAGAARRP